MSANRPTLAVLATELGVSRTTISNAFSRPDQLSEELRDRILAAAQRHGYTGPDPLARGLARGRVGIVAMLMGIPAGFAFADPAMRLILDGLAGTLAASETGLLLVPRTTELSQPIATVPADGFVVLCTDAGDPMTAAAKARGLPMVGIDQSDAIGDFGLRIDDYGGARLASEHVAGLGHRNIAVVTLSLGRGRDGGPVDHHDLSSARQPLAVERVRGHCEGIGHFADAEPTMVWEGAINARPSGRDAADAVLDAAPHTTAFVCSSDALAFGVIEAVHRRGLRVPEDISVVGFDDVVEASTSPVPLTTIRQPLFDRGTEAGHLILDLINGDDPAPPASQPVSLVVRSSTAPPRS